MRALALIAAMLIAYTPASAQIAANSKIDAVVQLELAPDPPLELTALDALDFGTVTIPNRLFENSRCIYTVRENAAPLVQEANDSQTSGNVGTVQSGCRFVTTPVAGKIQFRCIADRTMIINVVFAAGTDASLRLRAGLSALGDADGGNRRVQFDGLPIHCAAAGSPGKLAERFLRIGGTLTVSQNYTLPLKSKITVGTITVDATYS